MVRKIEADEDRFWRRVNLAGPVPATRPDLGPCWLWMGSHIRGYGQFSVGSRTDGTRGQVKAHRFAYELEEAIPVGLTLDHLCRTTLCVRKSHLEPVTAAVNTMRGDNVTTRNRDKTVCSHGHPFDTTRNGRRACLTCGRETMRRYRARHPEHAPITDAQRAYNRERMREWRARQKAHNVNP